MTKFYLFLLAVLFVSSAFSQDAKFEELMQKFDTQVNSKNYAQAIALGDELLTYYKKKHGTENMMYLSIRNKVIFMYYMFGSVQKANLMAVDNYRKIQKNLGENNSVFIEILDIMLQIDYTNFNIAGLDSLFDKREKYFKKNTKNYAVFLNNKGDFFRLKGDFSNAINYFLKSLNTYKSTTGKGAYYAIALHNLGLSYYYLGVYNKAEKYYHESLKILNKCSQNKEISNYIIKIRHSLAIVSFKLDKLILGNSLFLEYLSQLSKNTPEYYLAYYSVAQQSEDIGNIPYSKKFYKQIIKDYKRKKNIYLQLYLAANNSLARLYYREGKYNLAEKMYLESLHSFEANNLINSDVHKITMSNLANLYRNTKNTDKAYKFYKRTAKSTKTQIKNNFLALTEKEKFKHTKIFKSDFETFQNFVFDTQKIIPEATGEMFNQLLFYKRLILFNTRSFQRFVNNSNDAELKETYKNLYNLRQEIANLQISRQQSAKKNQQKYKQSDSLENEVVRLVNEKFPNRKIDFTMQNIDYKALQKKLKTNEAIIEFTHFKRFNKHWKDTTYYCALVLKKNYDVPKLVFLTTENKLKKILQRPGKEITENEYIGTLYDRPEKSKLLYQLVWSKLDTLLNDVENIYLSPSQLLHNVSFDALPYKSQKLSDKYKFYYLTSSKNILLKKSLKIEDIKKAYLFGDAQFELDSTQANEIANKSQANRISMRSSFLFENERYIIKKLPATAAEVDSIAEMLSKQNINTQVFKQHNASEECLKNIAESESFLLHIGTHGYYLPDIEEEKKQFHFFGDLGQNIDASAFKSGLFLSAAQNTINDNLPNNMPEDGIVTAYEISLQNFENCRLAVLSACQTGLGDVKGHEGIIGLSRALKTAGVDYLIISLWKVPSKATQKLMQLFYKNLALGKKVEDAFKAAQNKMKEEYANLTYYWAGFRLLN